jgi:hypothetical protein
MVLGGLLTGVIVLTQQVISGVQLEAHAHYGPLILFVFMLATGVCWEQVRDWPALSRSHLDRMLPWLTILVIGVVSMGARISSDAFARLHNPAFPESQDEREVYLWFRERGIRDRVVYAPHEMSDRIVLYTANYVAFSPLQRFLLISTRELAERYQYADVLNRSEALSDLHEQVFWNTYRARWAKDRQSVLWVHRILGRMESLPTLDSYVDEAYRHVQGMRENQSREGFRTYLRRFQVEYVIHRTREGGHYFYQAIGGDVVLSNEQYTVKRLGTS